MARNDTEAAAVILVLLTARSLRKRRAKEAKKKPRTVWVKPWIANRAEKSAFVHIFAELRLHDQEEFRSFLRMNTDTYQVNMSFLA